MKNTLNLHLIQWRIVPGDVETNLDRAGKLIASAAPGKGDLILLPEMFSSGFYYENLGQMAYRSRDVLSWMTETAQQYEVGLAGSVPMERPGGISNTMVLTNEKGRKIASYDKVHLFHVADEDVYFTPGEKAVVARWGDMVVGMAVCFDLRFPEMMRKLCDGGAQITLVSAQWPRARIDHFRDFARVRAMENQMFMASCNSCGADDKGLVMGGQSTVVGPSGDVKGVLGEGEDVLTVTIDVKEVERTREAFPVLKVRRKDLFGGK